MSRQIPVIETGLRYRQTFFPNNSHPFRSVRYQINNIRRYISNNGIKANNIVYAVHWILTMRRCQLFLLFLFFNWKFASVKACTSVVVRDFLFWQDDEKFKVSLSKELSRSIEISWRLTRFSFESFCFSVERFAQFYEKEKPVYLRRGFLHLEIVGSRFNDDGEEISLERLFYRASVVDQSLLNTYQP